MTDTSAVEPSPQAPVIPTPPAPASPAVEACKRDRRGDILAFGSLALLAYVVTLVFAVVILGIKIDPVVLTLVSVVVTAVTCAVGIVYGFQFGSSQGSQDKTAAMVAQTPPTTSVRPLVPNA